MGAAISYSGDNVFHITSQGAEVYSFAFQGESGVTNINISPNYGYNTEWTSDVGSSDTIVFTSTGAARVLGNEGDTGNDPDGLDFFVSMSSVPQGATNKTIYWVSSNAGSIDKDQTPGSVYTGTTVNSFEMTFSTESGGDPHINPIINPYNTTLILPSNSKIYNYLYYHDDTETISINAEMWQLSHDRIVFAEELRRDLSFADKNKQYLATPEKKEALPKALNNITLNPLTETEVTENDPSFIKTLYIYYRNKTTNTESAYTVDMETLNFTSHNQTEESNITFTEKKPLLTPKMHEGKIKFERQNGDSYQRNIKFVTDYLNNIEVVISRDTHRLNHRNNIFVRFFSHYVHKVKIHSPNVKGALIHPDRIYTVPTLETTDFNQFQKEPIPEPLSEYYNRNAKRLKSRRFKIRDMVRAHDFSLLNPSLLNPSQ